MGIAANEHQAATDLSSGEPAFVHRGSPEGIWAGVCQRLGVAPDPTHLTRRYVFALTFVAVVSMVGQALVQNALTRHAEDAHVINVAGRQRMLSQRITKAALAFRAATTPNDRQIRRDEMTEVLTEWSRVHRAIQHRDPFLSLDPGGSSSIDAMIARVETSFVAMASSAVMLIALEPGEAQSDAAMDRLMTFEPAFLSGMDDIVNRFQEEADARVTQVRVIELFLLSLVLVTLLAEGLLIFRPAVSRIRDTWARLHEASDRLSRSEAEKSAMLRAIPDVMFRLDRQGTIHEARAPAAMTDPASGQFVAHALPEVSARYLAHADAAISSGVVTSFEYPISVDGEARHHEARFAACGPEEVLVIVRDLTERRELEREILAIGERERERIGQDIHDGLCQLLAGIRLGIDSLAVRAAGGATIDAGEIASIGDLSRRALEEASGVSRGLYIASLTDGLPSAFAELVSRSSSLHPASITYDIELGEAQLPHAVVLQMYRIAQEALNNALKHAMASHIHIAVHRDAVAGITMTIADDGIGIGGLDKERRGMGMRIMQSRAHMIDAVLEIERSAGRGTVVSCRLPVCTSHE